jgi:hypothetical protein
MPGQYRIPPDLNVRVDIPARTSNFRHQLTRPVRTSEPAFSVSDAAAAQRAEKGNRLTSFSFLAKIDSKFFGFVQNRPKNLWKSTQKFL